MKHITTLEAKLIFEWQYYGDAYIKSEKCNDYTIITTTEKGELKSLRLDFEEYWLKDEMPPPILINDDGTTAEIFLNDKSIIYNLLYIQYKIENSLLIGLDLYIETCQLKVLNYINKNKIIRK